MSHDLTAFELLLRASDVRLPSAWQAAWEGAEEILAALHPEGYDVTEVGRLAYDSLHDDLKPAARDALFYGWWEAEQDRHASTAQTGGEHSGSCHVNVTGHRMVHGHCLYCGKTAEEAAR